MVPFNKRQDIVKQLKAKGVKIPCPEGVDIGQDVNPDRISGDGVIIHTGCKVYGADTLIMSGTEIGYEAPVTLDNCQLGRGVKLKGGYFNESTFLDGASMGSGAQIREACLLEEGAKGAHTVGLKQTILFPFVTLGSLINFCDCLMAGGTDDKNHSEVGSSYIHFNYTPNQDKATASLIGDVPRGVMINQAPIFLGGQGGLVGPVTIEYGNIVAAGTLVRKDLLKSDMMLLGHSSISRSMPFKKGALINLKRILTKNTIYIANLIALRRWFLDVRSQFMNSDDMVVALHKGAVEKLDMSIKERSKRLGAVIEIAPASKSSKALKDNWHEIEDVFKVGAETIGDSQQKDEFLKIINHAISENGLDYIKVIKGLDKSESGVGVEWLQGLVDDICNNVRGRVPGLKIS